MKYIKIILATILLAFSLAAYAQQNDDLLELEDIIVVGQSHGFSDTLQAVPENFSYTKKSDLSEFDYVPKFQTFKVTPYSANIQHENQFVWHLLGGSKSIIDSRLVYNSTQSPLLRFSAEFHNDQFQSNWQNNQLAIHWLPQYKQYHSIFSYYRDLYELDKGNTLINTAQILSPSLNYNSAKIGNIKINANLSYSDLQQEMIDNDTVEMADFEAGIIANWQKNRLNAGLNADLVVDEFIAQAWLINDDMIFEQLGLWLALDQNQFAASLKYSQSFSLGNDFSLLLNNEPALTKNNRQLFLQDNHYLDISSDFRQENMPVNHNICWQYEGRFYAALKVNSRYVLNRMNYVLVLQPDEGSDLYYESQYLDLWENELSLNAKWQWNNLSFQHLAEYTLRSETINYKPVFEFSNKVNYQYQKLNAGLAVDYNTGRKDVQQSYLKDMLLLDITLQYQLIPNLKLTLKAANLTDNKYQKYELSASESINVLGGFELSF